MFEIILVVNSVIGAEISRKEERKKGTVAITGQTEKKQE
jgi:hypothetical protein